MKTLSLLFFLFIATGVFAQSLSMNDIMPSVGDSIFKKVLDNSANGGVGPNVPMSTGSGQTWNYNGLIAQSYVDTFIFYDTAGYSVDFPDAEIITQRTNSSHREFYSYSGGLKYWGVRWGTIMPFQGYKYTTPIHIVGFPINSTTSDSLGYSGTYYGMGTSSVVGSVKSEYMGDGTLTLPDGVAYQNAILIKRNMYPQGVGTLPYEKYEWYVPGCPMAVMTVDYYPNAMPAIEPEGQYYTGISNSLVGINKIVTKDLDITVYPNPTVESLTVETEETVEQISIITIGGQRVRTTNNTTFNVSDLNAGTYILEIQTAKGLAYKKIVKQ